MMAPILLTSLIMWSLILMKLMEIGGVIRHQAGVRETISMVRDGVSPKAAVTPLAQVAVHFMEQMTVDRKINQELLSVLVSKQKDRLSKNINSIYVLASIAPLLGLLGTVGGMIATFDAIAIYGTGNARAMAQGISAALITTQSGLFVSIPGLFMASFLHRRIGRITFRLDKFRSAMMKEMQLDFPLKGGGVG